MNTIKQDIGKYLSLRRSLGYKLRGYDRILGQFADFLQQPSASYITRNLALAWLQQCNGKSGIWNQRLVAVRGFALYRQAPTRAPKFLNQHWCRQKIYEPSPIFTLTLKLNSCYKRLLADLPDARARACSR